MTRITPAARYAAIALAAILVLPACSDSNTLGPGNQLEVTNATDNFQFQVSNMEKIEQTETYTWAHTGTQATVNISESITAGSVILTIEDDAGTQVYQEDIASTGSGETTVGVAGDWTITVKIQKATGTFNFRVQKKT